jgi:hypothetical protein
MSATMIKKHGPCELHSIASQGASTVPDSDSPLSVKLAHAESSSQLNFVRTIPTIQTDRVSVDADARHSSF